MIRLDSVKLQLTDSAIQDINLDDFKRNYHKEICPESKQEITTSVDYYLPSSFLNYGTKSIQIKEKEKSKTIQLEFSAKALKENYFDLITSNTISQAIDNINCKSISFNKDAFLQSNVLKFDTTNNCRMEFPVQNYVNQLQDYRINNRYTCKTFDLNSIIFNKDVKTKRLQDRLTAYNKLAELMKDAEILKFVNINQFMNILRIECNLRHFEQFRKHLKINDTFIKLDKVLQNNQKVNLEIFNDITKNIQVDFFNDEIYGNMKLHELEKRIGRESIVKLYNFDMKRIRKFIRSRLSENTKASRYYSEYRKICSEIIRLKNEKEINFINQDLIPEIRQKLTA